MPSEAEVQQLGQQIDAIPDLSGAGIGFIGRPLRMKGRGSAATEAANRYLASGVIDLYEHIRAARVCV
jgi:hypothetical protein